MEIWTYDKQEKHGKIRDTSPLTKLRNPISKPSSLSTKANHPQAPQH